MIRWIIYTILGYAVLFTAVWMHEIGHSFLEYKFGCKDNWIHVQVKPYIFFSTPGPVDIGKYQTVTLLNVIFGLTLISKLEFEEVYQMEIILKLYDGTSEKTMLRSISAFFRVHHSQVDEAQARQKLHTSIFILRRGMT